MSLKEYIALGACMLIPAVSNGVFISCFPLWVVPWIDQFRVPRSTAMTGFAVGNLVMGLVSPVVGYCLGRFTARACVTLGGIALALGFLLVALASSFWQIVVIFASVLALGAAFTGMLPAQSVAVRILPHKAGTLSGMITLGISAGGIVLPGALTGPVARLGWRPAFLITSAIVAVTVVPSAWFLLRASESRGAQAHPAATAHGAQAAHYPLRALLGKLAFWVPLMGVVPAMFVVGTILPNAVAIAADSGISIGMAGYLVPAIAAGGAVGSVGLGWLCDRLNYRWVFSITATVVVIALLLLLTPHVGAALMACTFFAVGVVAGGVFPVVGVMVVRNFGSLAFAGVMGMMMPALIIALAVAPVIAGWVRDVTGSYDVAFGYCAGLMLMSALSVLILRPVPMVGSAAAATASAG